MDLPDKELGIRATVRCQSLQERQRRKLPLIRMGQIPQGMYRRKGWGRHMDRCRQACSSVLKEVITESFRWRLPSLEDRKQGQPL